MNLEIKDLCPYLPYKLMVSNDGGINGIIRQMNALDLQGDKPFQSNSNTINAKPILRPLSDLYKVKGKNNQTLPEFWKSKDVFADFHLTFDEVNLLNIATIEVRMFMSLLENHYDVFGLIEKGLAISYNDVNI